MGKLEAVYVRTEKDPEKTFKGQGQQVLDALKTRGGSATASELAEDTKDAFVGSKQDSTRIVKFYVARYTRNGMLKKIEPQAPPVGEGVAATPVSGEAVTELPTDATA